jgi:single-strand DNA-binding protein
MAGETPITAVGNLTDAPEIRVTPSGVSMARFTVASTPRTYNRQTGDWQDGDALFLRCTAWRDLAEHAAESLERGTRVIVTGRLKQDNWEDKDTGAKRSAIVMEVDEVGPSLRFAQAKVTRVGGERGNGGGSRNPVKTNDFDSEAPF